MTKLLSNIYHLTIENQLIVLASGCLPHIVHQERCWSAPNFSARGPGESSSHFPPLCKLCLVAYFWNIVVPTYRKRSLDSNRDPMHCSTPGFPVLHHLLELTQTHVHQVGDAIQPSHPLLSPSPPAFNLSQHQGLFQWVGSSHHVGKVLELQLQHQLFQRIFRVGFL